MAGQLVARQHAAEIDTRITTEIVRAFDDVEERFDSMQSGLLELAQSIGSSPEIREGLRVSGGPLQAPSEQVVSYFSSLDTPELVSVELYSPQPRLLAWTGHTFPLDQAPSEPRFLEAFQTAVSIDDDRRVGISVWWPVVAGNDVLGVVRVVRTVVYYSPVSNKFLRDVRLEESWRNDFGYGVTLEYPERLTTADESRITEQTLFGIDGKPLAIAILTPPSARSLIAEVETIYEDVAVFWLGLLLFWALVRAWSLFRTRLAREKTVSGRSVVNLILFSVFAIAVRFALLWLNIPGRYQPGKAPLSPLFDPSHLASQYAFGTIQSVGELFLTAATITLIAVACVLLVTRFLSITGHRHTETPPGRLTSTVIGGALTVSAPIILAVLLSQVLNRLLVDSTLDYFARTGLLPENLVILVIAAALMLAFSALTISGSLLAWLFHTIVDTHNRRTLYLVIAAALLFAALVYVPVSAAGTTGVLGIASYSGFLLASYAAGILLWRKRKLTYNLLNLRSILPSILLITIVTYPFLFDGLDTKTRNSMVDAVDYFDQGQDPRVTFAVDRLLEDVRSNDNLLRLITRESDRNRADSMMTSLVRGSLFSSLNSYDLSLTLFSKAGRPVGRYYVVDRAFYRDLFDASEEEDFKIVRQMYEESGRRDPLVETMTGRLEPERFRYQGLASIVVEADTLGWLLARAEPKSVLVDSRTPFPNVLFPTSINNTVSEGISLAEFRDRTLIRNYGDSFGRFTIGEQIESDVVASGSSWINENLRGRKYLTYYRSKANSNASVPSSIGMATGSSIVAARTASANIFDHLYYLLRLTVAGLFVALPVYIVGLVRRRQLHLIPARRVQFRDKVLNAFFAVGLITVITMGVVGLEVVTEENDRAIQSWLRQHLERVENTLLLDAQPGELPSRTLERTSIDSLAARVGLDLNVYRGTELVASSRPQLVRDRLIATRLPMSVYEAFNFGGYRFTTSNEKIGTFHYTAGYRAFPDESGKPIYVVSVPTLPEQERIEEERARTVAYLFGALLLLVLVVMITASLLANALTRPIGRLREGLVAVARGRFSQIPPLKTRDEISELVTTFNDMQEQLAESRRRLTRQERQLAWREMARQVAHEIKNPLTPMKLSVQHLRRSMTRAASEKNEKFDSDFDRITRTLVEQIDSLARIANEFSTFARMPQRVVEELELNEVVQEAVSLMQAEESSGIRLDVAASPLWVAADREELRRIYINLIKNALQSAPEGKDVEVVVTTRLDANTAYIYSSIQDNGSGIVEGDRDKIFVPNFSTKTSGTGLGLAIVRESIEDMRGEIGFDSQVGVGSTFWIKLPRIDSGDDTDSGPDRG
ncbi:MAG: HAMP domain-containing protein [Rhodothermales bacterium]|nr:HAMP domain-containing protein [Rhodothermales bacterium]